MEVQRKLARELLEAHAADAAAVLETLTTEETAALLTDVPARASAAVLGRLAPQAAVAALEFLTPEQAAPVVAELPLEVAAGFLRRMQREPREALVGRLPQESARSLELLMRFAPGTAGALMDPRVLALPEDVSAEQALRRLRRAPHNTLYNVYVIDRDQRLVGVLNLRELLLARPADPLSAGMLRRVQRVRADLDSQAIVAHPGWREVHSLPVVDEHDVFLGAIRYRTLRRLEEQLRVRDRAPGVPTAQALGDLFWTGVAGVLEAVTAASATSAAPPERS